MNHLYTIPNSGVIVDPVGRKYVLNLHDQPTVNKVHAAFGSLAHFSQQGPTVLAVLPMHADTIRILQNIGLPTMGMEPYWFDYLAPAIEGKHRPMWHQMATAAYFSINQRGYCGSQMRTGKTAAMILGMDYLRHTTRNGAALIVATVSTLNGVWARALRGTLPHARVRVLHGDTTPKGRIAELKKGADYFVINYDGVKMIADALTAEVRQGVIDKVVLDEVTHYGNPSSQRWKSAAKVCRDAPCVWGLSGSLGADPKAVFAYSKIITPWTIKCDTKTAWEYLCYYRYGPEPWQLRERAECPHLVSAALQPIVRFKKSDVMDLPPVAQSHRDCPLSAEQNKARKQLNQQMVALFEAARDPENPRRKELIQVEAINQAALANKLMQVALGAVIDHTGEIRLIDNKPRMEVIEEIIQESQAKVVIFGSYIGVNEQLTQYLRHVGYTVEKVDGGVTGRRRDDIFHRFQYSDTPRILVAHPVTTAFGVELAAADTMIFNGPPLSGQVTYAQALERMSSLAQTGTNLNIIKLSATTEERRIFKSLDEGHSASEAVNDLLSDLTRTARLG